MQISTSRAKSKPDSNCCLACDPDVAFQIEIDIKLISNLATRNAVVVSAPADTTYQEYRAATSIYIISELTSLADATSLGHFKQQVLLKISNVL